MYVCMYVYRQRQRGIHSRTNASVPVSAAAAAAQCVINMRRSEMSTVSADHKSHLGLTDNSYKEVSIIYKRTQWSAEAESVHS